MPNARRAKTTVTETGFPMKFATPAGRPADWSRAGTSVRNCIFGIEMLWFSEKNVCIAYMRHWLTSKQVVDLVVSVNLEVSFGLVFLLM